MIFTILQFTFFLKSVILHFKQLLISLFNALAQWFWKEVVTNVQFTDSQRADSVIRQAHELPAQFNYKFKRGNKVFLYENRLKGLLTMPEIFSLFCSLKNGNKDILKQTKIQLLF